jgi:thiamine biosynthesis lipoprotein
MSNVTSVPGIESRAAAGAAGAAPCPAARRAPGGERAQHGGRDRARGRAPAHRRAPNVPPTPPVVSPLTDAPLPDRGRDGGPRRGPGRAAARRAAGRAVRREFAEVHMGVATRVVLYAPDDRRARRAARAAFARVAALEDVMSDWRPASELRRLERRPGAWVPVSAPLFAVLARAVDVARASDGAFDPTVGPLVALWREARRRGALPEAAALDSARARVGWRRLALDAHARRVRLAAPGMRLDLGGIAKGYILQAALAELRAHGVRRALVEAGGDVVVGDAPPGRAGWQVDAAGLDAGGADSLVARRVAALARAAVSTSGPTAQFVEIGGVRYSHVVDPRTGLGLRNARAATVVAPDGATADALSTVLTVVAPAEVPRLLARFPGVAASVRDAAAADPTPGAVPAPRR